MELPELRAEASDRKKDDQKTWTKTWIPKVKAYPEEIYRETRNTDSTLFLEEGSNQWTAQADFSSMRMTFIGQNGRSNFELPIPITKVTFEDCDLRLLRPLQGAAGLGEVEKKKKDIDDNLNKERNDLENDPIKVVRGPDGDFFVQDHHHTALAWIDYQTEHPKAEQTGTCQLLADPPLSKDAEIFWSQLKDKNWVRLVDKDGKPIEPKDLPQKLTDLPNDPYRTLAWMIRKADDYCRELMKPQPPFAEFRWADWMRNRPDLFPLGAVKTATNPNLWAPGTKKKDRENAQSAILKTAYSAARSRDTPPADLPGYRDNQDVQVCNPKQSE